MHLSPRWLRLLSVLRRWFCCYWLFVYCFSHCGSLCCSMFCCTFFMSILVLQSSWWGKESWLLCLICLPGVSWWLSGSSSRCQGVVCSLWLWYFLIILTYYFWKPVLLFFLSGRLRRGLLYVLIEKVSYLSKSVSCVIIFWKDVFSKSNVNCHARPYRAIISKSAFLPRSHAQYFGGEWNSNNLSMKQFV